MKKTTKLVLMSILTIALCVSLIVGATFALFTDEKSSSIDVNAGVVQLDTTVGFRAWSALWDDAQGKYVAEDKVIEDNRAEFTAGGFASLDGVNLKLERMVPGDGATLTIGVTNKSNVLIKYRLVIVIEDNGLLDSLEISYAKDSANIVLNEAEGYLYSDWFETEDTKATDLGAFSITVQLPDTADNSAQGKSCSIDVSVFAVQINGHITDTEKLKEKDVVLNSELLDGVVATGITSKSLVVGSWSTYADEVGCDYSEGVVVANNNNVRAFEVGDKVYVLVYGKMFTEASYSSPLFAQYSFTDVDLSDVDFSRATNLNNMFKNCSSLETLILANADLSNATDLVSGANLSSAYNSNARINNVFDGCTSLKLIDLSNSNLSSMTDAKYGSGTASGLTDMFYGCDALETVNLSGADLSGLTDMMYAFLEHPNLISVDLSGANLCNATTLEGLCQGSNNIQWVDLSGADLSSVTTVTSMFAGKQNLQWVDLSNTNLSKVTDVSGMFESCNSLEWFDFSGTDLSNVTTMQQMFRYCEKLTSIDLSEISDGNLSKVTTILDMFNGCSALQTINFAGVDFSGLTKMQRVFANCKALISADFSDANLSSVTDMWYAFQNCSSLTDVNFSGADLSGGVEMYYTFDGCTKLGEVNFTNAKVSIARATSMFQNTAITSFSAEGIDFSKNTDLSGMFKNCTQLTKVDFSNADLSSVRCQGGDYMDGMFSNCTSLKEINFSGANLSGLYNNVFAFSKLASVEIIDFRGADLSNLTSGYGLFQNSTSLQTVYLWSDIKLTYISNMFNGCAKLEHIYVAEGTSLAGISASSSSNMFAGCENLHNWDGVNITATKAHAGEGGYFEVYP